MSNARRPSTQRKSTTKTEANRKAALDQGISIKFDSKTYTVRMGDLSANDTMALRRATGMSFMAILSLPPAQFDIDVIAAIVWLARRVDGEYGLEYETVATLVGYDSDIDVVDTPEDDSPEA